MQYKKKSKVSGSEVPEESKAPNKSLEDFLQGKVPVVATKPRSSLTSTRVEENNISIIKESSKDPSQHSQPQQELGSFECAQSPS